MELPAQTLAFPVMDAGASGALFTLIANVCREEMPQPFFALTVTFPPVEPANTNILLVVDAPVHPSGKVQVYEEAPDTSATV